MKAPELDRNTQGSANPNTDSGSAPTQDGLPGNVLQRALRKPQAKYLGIGLGVVLTLGLIAPLAVAYNNRYGSHSLMGIPLFNEPIEGQNWKGEGVSFQQLENDKYDVSFNLSEGGPAVQLALRDIDLNLFIPQVPDSARGNKDLTRWFLTEREFNRQRVKFEPGSPHIELSEAFADYAPEDISVSLTNNCLGAGYWELAVFYEPENGDSKKLYQGYFTFPRGEYAKMVAELNPTKYHQVARTMEAWPGFRFLSGMNFNLNELRQVNSETQIPVTDLKTEQILAVDEQVKKANLIVYPDGSSADSLRTWEDLRKTDLKFHGFVTPGIYDEEVLWDSDFKQIANVTGATGRQISSPMSEKELIEVEIGFEGEAGEIRRLIISGIDLEEVPQLDVSEYPSGIYVPLGFGTPFTQNYTELAENPPAEYAFFSVVLDQNDGVVDYRKDIGLNGIIMHRDSSDPNKLHLFVMSYERITLVGHYVIDLGQIKS